jgi:hypothetical protein
VPEPAVCASAVPGPAMTPNPSKSTDVLNAYDRARVARKQSTLPILRSAVQYSPLAAAALDLRAVKAAASENQFQFYDISWSVS